jgi:hypothetical protein
MVVQFAVYGREKSGGQKPKLKTILPQQKIRDCSRARLTQVEFAKAIGLLLSIQSKTAAMEAAVNAE